MTFLKVNHPSTKAEECVHLSDNGKISKWMLRNDSPPLCGTQYSDETLAVFKSYKLDDMQASKRKLEDLRSSGGEHVYFAKFLTSEKVRDLLTPRKICN